MTEILCVPFGKNLSNMDVLYIICTSLFHSAAYFAHSC